MKVPRWLYLAWLRVTWWLRDTLAPTGAGLRVTADGQDSMQVDFSMDEILKLPSDHALILLIDIDGGELHAMRGGMSLMTR